MGYGAAIGVSAKHQNQAGFRAVGTVGTERLLLLFFILISYQAPGTQAELTGVSRERNKNLNSSSFFTMDQHCCEMLLWSDCCHRWEECWRNFTKCFQKFREIFVSYNFPSQEDVKTLALSHRRFCDFVLSPSWFSSIAQEAPCRKLYGPC